MKKEKNNNARRASSNIEKDTLGEDNSRSGTLGGKP